jgi:C_GCAxxG_C_C family probable redox protein
MSNSNADKIQKKEMLFEKVYRLAFDFEKEKHYCSQCTVAALQEVFQIKSEDLFSSSFALGGGLANTCEGTCGGLAGGAMVISYFYGRRRVEFFKDIPNKKANYLTKELYDRFIQEYGSCLCKDVQKKIFGRSFNFRDEKEKKIFEKSGGHIDKCPAVVAKAAQWAFEIIEEEINQGKEKADKYDCK